MISKHKRATVAVAAVGALALTACQDLLVENQNQPDRHRALTQPDAVEALVSSAYPRFHSRFFVGTAGYFPLSHAGDEWTSTITNNDTQIMSQIPRVPFNNNPVVGSHAVANLFWSDMYEVFANASDALVMINNGMRIMTGDPVVDNTHRTRVVARLAQGMSMGYLGLLFDRAFVIDETTPVEFIERPVGNLELQQPDAAVAKAVELLMKGVQLVQQDASFVVPADFLYSPTDLTPQDLVERMHGYAARFLVLNARSPEERATRVNWSAVLDHASRVTRDVQIALGTGARVSNYMRYASAPTGTRSHTHIRLYGPADVSGAYQAWLQTPPEQRERFLMVTPDRRITGETPTTNGLYFRYMAANNIGATQGNYRQSFYQWFRRGNNWNTGTAVLMTVDEMRLYMAEAHYHLGNRAMAAQLINVTRVGNGQLPPVTADGIPASEDCVPRTVTGACGSLLDALAHERMMETSYLDPTRTWLDRRGFGTLESGQFIHLPIPAAQLEILGMPIYTFGGAGEGSAP
jgi:hypothetical protein